MTRFNAKAAAAALIALGAICMVFSLVTGYSAQAEVPPDLRPNDSEAAIDVWKAATLLAGEPRAVLVDVRPEDAYARYHLPRAVSAPGAKSEQVKDLLRSAPAVIIYAGKDEVAQKLVGEVKGSLPGAHVHYLVDGARAWYLAFQLPVPLFAESPPPSGYPEALQVVNGWLSGAAPGPSTGVVQALQTLAKANYQPSLLRSGKKTAAGGGAKKISGGCG